MLGSYIDPIMDKDAIGREVRGVGFGKAASGKMLAYVSRNSAFRHTNCALGR